MRFLLIFSALLLSVLLPGCAVGHALFPEKVPMVILHGDEQYTIAQRKCMEDSADVWRNQTSGVADIQIVWDYNSAIPASIATHKDHNKIVWADSKTPIIVEMESDYEPGQRLLGLVMPSGGIHNRAKDPVEVRLIMDRMDDQRVCRLTAIHELGHLLGTPHISRNRENIMYPSIMSTRTVCLKPDDLLGFCFVNDCGSVKMKPCSDEPTGLIVSFE